MNVQVKDGLARSGPDVQHSPIASLDVPLARDLRGREVAAANDLGVAFLRFFQPREMPSRNDQYMGGRLWIDVFKGEHMGVFMDLFGGNFTADDAAEKAIRAGIGHDLPSFYRKGRAVKA